MSEQYLINLENVVKTYSSGSGEVTVLRGVNLKVKPGEAVGVRGPTILTPRTNSTQLQSTT